MGKGRVVALGGAGRGVRLGVAFEVVMSWDA